MTATEIATEYNAKYRTVARAIQKVLANRGEAPKRGRAWSNPSHYDGADLQAIRDELARLGYVVGTSH